MTTTNGSGPWLFYGGTVALDFVNTLRGRTTTPRETLVSPAALTVWLEEAGLLGTAPESSGIADATSANTCSEAVDLREAVDAVLVPGTARETSHVRLVNRWALLAPLPQLHESDPGTVVTPVFTVTEALGTVAADAIAVIARGEQGRVKTCAHERCGLRYLDRSRAGQRQWCSMQRCGNRAKAARHATRRNG